MRKGTPNLWLYRAKGLGFLKRYTFRKQVALNEKSLERTACKYRIKAVPNPIFDFTRTIEAKHDGDVGSIIQKVHETEP